MQPPPSIQHPPQRVFHLCHTIYRLKEVPCAWFECFVIQFMMVGSPRASMIMSYSHAIPSMVFPPSSMPIWFLLMMMHPPLPPSSIFRANLRWKILKPFHYYLDHQISSSLADYLSQMKYTFSLIHRACHTDYFTSDTQIKLQPIDLPMVSLFKVLLSIINLLLVLCIWPSLVLTPCTSSMSWGSSSTLLTLAIKLFCSSFNTSDSHTIRLFWFLFGKILSLWLTVNLRVVLEILVFIWVMYIHIFSSVYNCEFLVYERGCVYLGLLSLF